jgi:phosphatidylinositol alpha-1,6-mannosyltransferase
LLAADHIIVVSRFTQGAVLDMLGEKQAGRLTLIENGVDTAKFTPLPRKAALAACYELGDRFVFITVCRLLEKKGVDHALRAFAGVLRSYPETRYVIVGSGPFEDVLRDLADALGVASAVVFTGDVADAELAEHYQLGDVFVMPNRALPNGDTEGFGLVFLEANACGLPVIAGRDGGSADAVRDGENGVVVDGHSVAAVQEAMLRLRGDADERARLREGGLAAAAAADWRKKAAVFLQVCAGGA